MMVPKVVTSEGISRWTGTRSKAPRSTSNVASVLPSSTTTTSWRPKRSASKACTDVTITTSSL
jgi:hypothetical protein